MGEAEAAHSAYRSVVVLDPSLELDPISYPPDIIESYTAVRDEVFAVGTATLRVTSKTDDVEVFVDGRGVGTVPVAVEQLPVGTHHVYASGESGLRAYVSVEVAAGDNETLQVEMGDRMLVPQADSPTERRAQTQGLYAALGTYSQTPLVLLAGESSDEQVSLCIYSSRSGNFSQALTAPAGSDPVQSIVDLVPALGSYVTETGDIRPDRVAVSVPALDLADNAVLTQVLLDPNEEVQVQYIESGPKWYVWAAMGGHPMLSLPREHEVLVYVCVGRCQLWGGVELLESVLDLKRERASAGKVDFDLAPHGCLNRCAQAPMAIAHVEDGYVGMERAGVDDVRALLEEIDTLAG